MGLDMYLYAKQSFSNYDFVPKEKKFNDALRGLLGLQDFNDSNNDIEVNVTVAYWRKANAIHKWFVDNLQDGKDDCGVYYVSPNQLEELLQLCNTALSNRDATLLPPMSGFFFGSTDIDEGYWDDIQNTKDMLEKILNSNLLEGDNRYYFYYHASW